MSVRTTNFGPRVSLTTTLADAGPPHLYLDSNTTFEAAGTNTLSGALTASGGFTSSSAATFSGPVAVSGALTSTATVDATAATFLSRSTTASLTSLTLADGEVAVGAISASSCILYIRSGVTTYQFIAPVAGAVL